MRFRIFLESRENLQSWLDPQGWFHPVIGRSHNDDIRRHFPNGNIRDAWKLGWMRVTYYGRELYANNDVMPPNYRQKSSLIDLAMSNKIPTIYWDAGEDYRVLWSADRQ